LIPSPLRKARAAAAGEPGATTADAVAVPVNSNMVATCASAKPALAANENNTNENKRFKYFIDPPKKKITTQISR
jgi:hypothetical protein